MVPSMQLPITLYCDNSGVVANSKEPRAHKKGKHIEHKYHLIRDIVQGRDVWHHGFEFKWEIVRAIYTKIHFYGYLFYFNKIMLFHFNENLHELSLHLNIMHVCLLFYIVDDLVCRVRLTHKRSNHRFLRNISNWFTV